MPALNTVVDHVSARWCRVSAIADLAEIFDPGVQICSWQRTIDPGISSYLEDSTGRGTLQMRETLASGDRARLVDLPEAEGLELLRNDVTLLSEILCQLLDCPAVGLRCASVEHAMCPRWHIDHVPLRLLCTYAGAGTQWLDNQEVKHSDLAEPDIANSTFQRAATGEVVLLKGALWQGNEAQGAIHRSPAIASGSGRRVLMTLDPLWPD